MQSEGGAAAALHGAVQKGALAPDDPEHVQDRRRADQHGLPHRRALDRDVVAFDLRRSQRRDVHPQHRLGHALRQLRAGSDGLRADFAGEHVEVARAVSPYLRRLPHQPRGGQDRAADGRADARGDRRRADPRTPRPCAVAGKSVRARHGAESGHLLPGARGGQFVLRQGAGDRAGDDGSPGGADRTGVSPVRLRRCAGRRARDHRDGFGVRDGDHRLGGAERRRRKDRRADRASVPAVLGRAFRRGAAADGAFDRRAGSHEGAGRARRAAVSGRGGGAGRDRTHRRRARRRRSLRFIVEGIHAGDGARGLRRTGEARAEEPFHRRHHRRRDAHQPRLRRCVRRGGSAGGARGVLRPRAISSTTRRRPARARFRICVSDRIRSAART